MPEHTTRFDVADKTTMELPYELLASGGTYAVQVRDGDVYISGNSNGLLYLAEVIIRCAKGDYVESFHVHLPLDSRHSGPPTGTEVRDELVIFAASDEIV